MDYVPPWDCEPALVLGAAALAVSCAFLLYQLCRFYNSPVWAVLRRGGSAEELRAALRGTPRAEVAAMREPWAGDSLLHFAESKGLGALVAGAIEASADSDGGQRRRGSKQGKRG